MRVTIVGQRWLAETVLGLALAHGHQVVGVCAPAGDRLAVAAEDCKIPVVASPSDLPSSDIGIAAHAHAYLGPAARSRAALGFVGYHPSLLPRHRGRDAVRWTVHMREPIAGGTLYRMTDLVDGGPILSQAWCHVRPEWGAGELWREALAPIGLRLFAELFRDLAEGKELPAGEPQDETLATWEPSWARAPLAVGRDKAVGVTA